MPLSWYSAIVVSRDMIITVDFKVCKVQVYRRQDGKLLRTSRQLESEPRDICLINKMEICVLLNNGQMEIMSVDSIDKTGTITSVRTLHVQGGLEEYRAIMPFNNNLVVCGVKQETIYWSIVSLRDGHADSLHQIGKMYNLWSYITTKDNMLYTSCDARCNSPNAVYGYDMLDSSQYKCRYTHEDLYNPRGITIDKRGFIFVCSSGHRDACIHHLTDECQLVAIHRQGIPHNPRSLFVDQQDGHLYVSCVCSKVINIYEPVYQDNRASEDPMRDDINQPIIEEPPKGTGQKDLIQQGLKKALERAGIQMSEDEQDLFLRFQCEFGTTPYFSEDPEVLLYAKKSLDTTEKFIQKNRRDIMGKWHEYRKQGKLTPELIDAICAKEGNQELHDKKDHILMQMEKLKISVKARSFYEGGVKEEDYSFNTCMLHPESQRDVISPEKDLHMVSTSALRWVLQESFSHSYSKCFSQTV